MDLCFFLNHITGPTCKLGDPLNVDGKCADDMFLLISPISELDRRESFINVSIIQSLCFFS